MMFSYYGSKSKIIDLYPAPKYGKIIEPFAGSARYALKYWDRDVLLVDKYGVVIKVWHYLQQASVKDIMGLPEPAYKQDIRQFNLSEGEKALLGFLVARGLQHTCNIVQKFSDIPEAKKQIASQLDKVRHWKIELGDYRDIPNQEATWFVDPPYRVAGEYYAKKSGIVYEDLAQWCKERTGQTIVCENTKSNWLPFTPIGELRGSFSQTTEAIWCNDFEQTRMEFA